jgi:hypothetical protein
MDELQSHVVEPDRVTAALEASCGALLALEVARQEMVDAGQTLELATREVEQAIASLRQAIDLLYVAPAHGISDQDAERLSVGFVLRVQP